MSAALLAMDGVRANYGDFQALFNITLEIRAGEIVTLIGANGQDYDSARGLRIAAQPARAVAV